MKESNLIRIVPEWNVKTLFNSDTICCTFIRIVPEWNVKLEIAKLESDFHLLESYQSGM